MVVAPETNLFYKMKRDIHELNKVKKKIKEIWILFQMTIHRQTLVAGLTDSF